MTKTNQFETSQSKNDQHFLQAVKTLLSYLWPIEKKSLKKRVVFAMLCLVFGKMFFIYTPFIYKDIIDHLSPLELKTAIPFLLIIGYGLVRTVSYLFAELRDVLFITVGQAAIRESALKTFVHLHNLSLEFHLNRQTGGLSRIIERAIRGIEFVLAFMLFNIAPTLIEIAVTTTIFSYKFSFFYGLLAFTFISSYILYTIFVTEWRLKYRRLMNNSDNEANTKAMDSLINFETVKYFNNENHEARRYDHSLKNYETAAIKSQWSLSLLNIGQASIIGLGLTSFMYLSANDYQKGQISIGDFVLINTLLLQVFQPLNFFGFVYRQIKQSLLDMDKMFELLNIPKAIEDQPDEQELKITHGEIRVKDLSFSYQKERPILKNINFNLNPGKKLALVGPSGAGKSTLSRLLFRFYEIEKGEITIDKQNIRDVSQTSLRKVIGVVPQDTILFNDSIAYNIAYGEPNASREQIYAVAKMAHIHDFIISLPQGYESIVGERGLKLSGGEKQRIAIARVLLKKPKILVFDEATSALDQNTEKSILTALNEVSSGITTLIITHRLTTIIDVDEICVLKNGEIIERGQHEKLLKEDGFYAHMWKKQESKSWQS